MKIPKNESKEHRETVEFISKLTGGEIIITRSNSKIKNQYFPDIRTKDTDYEIELFGKKRHLLKKSEKWVNGKKKILVITIDNDSENLFDEIYYYKNGKLVKLS